MAPPRRPRIIIGLDAEESSRRSCVMTHDDEVLESKSVANTRPTQHRTRCAFKIDMHAAHKP